MSDSINALCRLCTKTTCTKHPEHGRSVSVKAEETVGAKPGPKIQYLQYFTPGSVQYVVAVPSDEWERVNRRAKEVEAEVESLRRDLEINAAMLAKQTDLARQAEVERKEAEDALQKVWDVIFPPSPGRR